jgi:hypothetical protein
VVARAARRATGTLEGMQCVYCGKPRKASQQALPYCSDFCLRHAVAEKVIHAVGAPPAPRLAVPPPTFGPAIVGAHIGVVVPDPQGGIKHDDGKLPIELLAFDVLEEVAKVLQFGAKKYAPNNWRAGFVYSRLFGALLRHLFAWWRGQDTDPETGLSHLAHAGCCLLFLHHFVLAKTGTDDRTANNK